MTTLTILTLSFVNLTSAGVTQPSTPPPAAQATTVASDTNTEPPATAVASEDPYKGVQLTSSLNFDFRTNKTQDTYRLMYRGKLVKEHGKDPTYLDPTHQFPLNGPGDTSDIVLNLTEGTTALNNKIFDVLGVKPTKFQPLGLGSLRGVVRLSGSFDRQFNLAAGLETPPIRPLNALGFKNPGMLNYLIVGFNGEYQAVPGANNKVVGLVTARMALGKAFGWHKDQGAEPDIKLDKALKELPKNLTVESFLAYARALPGDRMTLEQGFLKDTAGSIETWQEWINTDPNSAEYKEAVQELAALSKEGGIEQLLRDRFVIYRGNNTIKPRSAIWFEGSSWYAVNGNATGRDLRHQAALTYSYFGELGDGFNYSLNLRYEHGQARGDLLEKTNRLIASVGIVF